VPHVTHRNSPDQAVRHRRTTTEPLAAAWVEAADHGAAETMATITPKAKPTPKPRPRGPYESIAADLCADRGSGRLKPGDQLPTIVQLAAMAIHSAASGAASIRLAGAIER
jgi:hypothetical protein